MGSWSCDLERRLALDVPMAVGHYDDAGELYPCATAKFGICADRVRQIRGRYRYLTKAWGRGRPPLSQL